MNSWAKMGLIGGIAAAAGVGYFGWTATKSPVLTILPTPATDFGQLQGAFGETITFTRDSGFFCVSPTDAAVQYLTADEPCVTSTGLYVEPYANNLITRSEQFNTWSLYGDAGTVTINSSVAPDGETTADLFTISGGARHAWLTSATVQPTTSTTYVFSVYAKSNMADGGGLTLPIGTLPGDPLVACDYTTCNISSSSWTRCTHAFTVAGCESSTPFIGYASENSCFPGGSLESNYELWGAQLEVGEYPTSYVPTFSGGNSLRAPTSVSVDNPIASGVTDWCVALTYKTANGFSGGDTSVYGLFQIGDTAVGVQTTDTTLWSATDSTWAAWATPGSTLWDSDNLTGLSTNGANRDIIKAVCRTPVLPDAGDVFVDITESTDLETGEDIGPVTVCFDGLVPTISTAVLIDGGSSQLISYTDGGEYDLNISNNWGNPLGDRLGWCVNGTRQETFNLNAFRGQAVRLGFELGSDSSTGGGTAAISAVRVYYMAPETVYVNAAAAEVTGAGAVRFKIGDSAGGLIQVVANNPLVAATNDLMFCSKGGSPEIYVNGALAAGVSSGDGGSGVITTQPNTLYLGSTNSTNYASGWLSNIRVWDRAKP